jgi:hypothetical protein
MCKWTPYVTSASKLYLWNSGYGITFHSLSFNKRPANTQQIADFMGPTAGMHMTVKRNDKIYTSQAMNSIYNVTLMHIHALLK